MPRQTLTWRQRQQESWLILGVSLGASAIWSALSLLRTWIEAIQAHQSLNKSTATLNGSQSSVGWLDLIYQLVGIALALVPVALALHLLARTHDRVGRLLGIDRTQPLRDGLRGAGLAALIGIPGLGLYVVARAMGVNTTVAASGLGEHWWTIPVLILSAAQNAVLEEVIMIGYLFTRWWRRESSDGTGWSTWRVIMTSAVIRGSYHLYQGLGGFVGNVVMGMIFGWVYTKTRRVAPLIVAHTILDVVSFVGYSALHGHVSWL